MKEFSQDYTELKELLSFGFAFQDALVQSLADGKINLADIGNLWPIAMTAGPAFKNLGNPLSRYEALSMDEHADLISFARDRFDLPDDILEVIIEDTIREVYGDWAIAMRWKQYLKKAA